MDRIKSIDHVRGVVMIIMALDHVRDLIHVDALTQSPTNLATTTPLLFFTRWITYLCAPVFVFLSGVSTCLSFTRQNNIAKNRKFLIKRGLWLILLEFTVFNFGLYFDAGFHTLLFEVLGAIGIGFIVLGLMLGLRKATIGLIGLLIIFAHDVFPLIRFEEGSLLKNIISPLFNVTVVPLPAGYVLMSVYPPLPWLGLMLFGFAMGKLFIALNADERKRLFLKIGLGSLLLFTCLRLANFYGDGLPWSIQKNHLFTFLSFINISKYPPSLLFCLITLGIMFLLFALVEKKKNKILNAVSVYGKVPLFYFLIHFYIIHIVLMGILFLQGFGWADLSFASGSFGRPKNTRSGFELWLVYIIWIVLVMALYKPCHWFGRYKATHDNWWLKYI
ncbi:DUF1624 domain-containing protein [Chitinophaga niabensis]|uniref:Uncharacterized membrane protein n=1 Tax=Chitinophaga niabensis TaxID=536979 RepID=A0A1N6J045_9BACT|nr:heparan-alpha-glucosaminide N-acetyltransferase domain-containing protein [Chitinophaga niabensis]SIO37559.1 Uncharacterized membrane protein [Chitinophaga niabensis]